MCARASKMSQSQGGGRDTPARTVCIFVPMEVISSSQKMSVVQVSELTKVPSAQQVRQAISNLYKKREKVPDQFCYVKFPFGMLGYERLQQIKH